MEETLALKRGECDRWEDVNRKMRVDFHDDGIISQFTRYDDLAEFRWDGYCERYGNIQRLDRILEAEGDTPNRYEVSKQADVHMLFYLLSADELRTLFHRLDYPFEYETIAQDVDYYLKRTSHGSTLSRVIHSWVVARPTANNPGATSFARSRAISLTFKAARRPKASTSAQWRERSTSSSAATAGLKPATASFGSTLPYPRR